MFTLIPTQGPQPRRALCADVAACWCSWVWESPAPAGLLRPV